MTNNNKGITLIALVITIIVLLILAGVSIAMLSGKNGILTRATESTTETVQAEVEEKINMALNEVYTDILAGETTIAKPTIGNTDGKTYTVSDINKTSATVVTISYTGDSDIGNYSGSISYDSEHGKYTIHPASKTN